MSGIESWLRVGASAPQALHGMSLVIRNRARSDNRLPELHQSGQILARTQGTGSLFRIPYELLYPLFGTTTTCDAGVPPRATIFTMTKDNGEWEFESNNDFARFLERKNAESGLRDTAEMRKRISELEKRVASLEALVNKYVNIYQPNATTNKSLGDIAGTIGAPPSA